MLTNTIMVLHFTRQRCMSWTKCVVMEHVPIHTCFSLQLSIVRRPRPVRRESLGRECLGAPSTLDPLPAWSFQWECNHGAIILRDVSESDSGGFYFRAIHKTLILLSDQIQNMQRASRLVPNLPQSSWELWIHRETIIR